MLRVTVTVDCDKVNAWQHQHSGTNNVRAWRAADIKSALEEYLRANSVDLEPHGIREVSQSSFSTRRFNAVLCGEGLEFHTANHLVSKLT